MLGTFRVKATCIMSPVKFVLFTTRLLVEAAPTHAFTFQIKVPSPQKSPYTDFSSPPPLDPFFRTQKLLEGLYFLLYTISGTLLSLEERTINMELCGVGER
jgi:hypothetical protein